MRLEYLLFRASTYLLLFPLTFIFLCPVLFEIIRDQVKEFFTYFNVYPLISGLLLQIRSSAWLEHYTDNVGVTSSNLVGST